MAKKKGRKPCVSCNQAQAMRPGGLCNKCFGQKSEPFPVEDISLAEILDVPEAQPPGRFSDELAREYGEDIAAGAEFPPAVVFRDAEGRNWLSEGNHRKAAHGHAGKPCMRCEVRPGSRRDAQWNALGANRRHGKRRKPEERRWVVESALKDAEWSRYSDREIARQCDVSHPYVAKVRGELSGNGFQIDMRTVNRGGTTYEMDVSNIGPAAGPSEAALAAEEADYFAPGAATEVTSEVIPFDGGEGDGQQGEEPFTPGDAYEGEAPPAAGDAYPLPAVGGGTAPEMPDRPVTDYFGGPVPEHCRAAFADAPPAFRQAVALGKKYHNLIVGLNDLDGSERLNAAELTGHVNASILGLKSSEPYCVCPQCDGHGCAGDGICNRRGWLTRPEFDNLDPKLRARVQRFSSRKSV